MKFAREFPTEETARAYEATLRASGCVAWVTRKADGTWEVFWFVQRLAA